VSSGTDSLSGFSGFMAPLREISPPAAFFLAVVVVIALVWIFLVYLFVKAFGDELRVTLRLPTRDEMTRPVARWVNRELSSVGFIVLLLMYYISALWRGESRGMAGLLPRRMTAAFLIQGVRSDLSFFDAYPRQVAARTLGDIGDARAAPALAQALEEDLSSAVRRDAAEALGKIGDSGAVAVLTQTLGGDAVESVRRTSAEALGEIGHPEAVDALILALRQGLVDVRRAAAESLGKIGCALPTGDARLAEAAAALSEAVEDERLQVRRAAADALGRLC